MMASELDGGAGRRREASLRVAAPVVGIVGGVASGKSLVSRLLESLGAKRIDADRIGHQVLEEPEVMRAIRQRWGDPVFGSEGQVDRSAVAKRVFSSPGAADELAFLERLTHPRIAQRIAEQIAASRRADPGQPIVLDAAVMMKAGWHRFCDILVFVEAPAPVRRQRAVARGWSEAQWEAREAAQPELQGTSRQADWVIDNADGEDQTREQVVRLWREIQTGWTPRSESDRPS